MTDKDEVVCRMITDVYTLKDIFNVIIPIADKCSINLSDNGLNVSIIDYRHIASLNLDLSKEFISSYDINSSYILNFNVVNSIKMLEHMDDYENADIHLDINKEKDITMRLKIGILNHNIRFEKNEGYSSYSPIRTNDQLTEVSVNSKELKMITNEFVKFSDYIIFETRNGRLRTSCFGSYNHVNDHEIFAYIGEIDKNIKCIFDLDYLNNLVKAINTEGHWNGNITLLIGSDLPLHIKFNVGRYGNAIYTLAPRIQQ